MLTPDHPLFIATHKKLFGQEEQVRDRLRTLDEQYTPRPFINSKTQESIIIDFGWRCEGDNDIVAIVLALFPEYMRRDAEVGW